MASITPLPWSAGSLSRVWRAVSGRLPSPCLDKVGGRHSCSPPKDEDPGAVWCRAKIRHPLQKERNNLISFLSPFFSRTFDPASTTSLSSRASSRAGRLLGSLPRFLGLSSSQPRRVSSQTPEFLDRPVLEPWTFCGRPFRQTRASRGLVESLAPPPLNRCHCRWGFCTLDTTSSYAYATRFGLLAASVDRDYKDPWTPWNWHFTTTPHKSLRTARCSVHHFTRHRP